MIVSSAAAARSSASRELSKTVRATSASLTNVLFADIDLAITLLDATRATGDAKCAARNLHNAHQTHANITRIMPRLTRDANRHAQLADRLSALHARLDSAEALINVRFAETADSREI
jgi:hypothetical protein